MRKKIISYSIGIRVNEDIHNFVIDQAKKTKTDMTEVIRVLIEKDMELKLKKTAVK